MRVRGGEKGRRAAVANSRELLRAPLPLWETHLSRSGELRIWRGSNESTKTGNTKMRAVSPFDGARGGGGGGRLAEEGGVGISKRRSGGARAPPPPRLPQRSADSAKGEGRRRPGVNGERGQQNGVDSSRAPAPAARRVGGWRRSAYQSRAHCRAQRRSKTHRATSASEREERLRSAGTAGTERAACSCAAQAARRRDGRCEVPEACELARLGTAQARAAQPSGSGRGCLGVEENPLSARTVCAGGG